MAEENSPSKVRRGVPEGFWRFLIICFIVYAFFIVGKVVFDNYQKNRGLKTQQQQIADLKDQIANLQYNIAYYKTATYKEKVARAKLRYILPGETAVAVPYDEVKTVETKNDSGTTTISRPNYVYWSMYFFGSNSQ